MERAERLSRAGDKTPFDRDETQAGYIKWVVVQRHQMRNRLCFGRSPPRTTRDRSPRLSIHPLTASVPHVHNFIMIY
jgi:hypothetical protein